MMTVRFPTGVSVVYNDANYLKYDAVVWELYTKNPDCGGTWICSIPANTNCVVEHLPACRVENAVMDLKKAANVLGGSQSQLRKCASGDLAKLKRLLKHFDLRTYTWKW